MWERNEQTICGLPKITSHDVTPASLYLLLFCSMKISSIGIKIKVAYPTFKVHKNMLHISNMHTKSINFRNPCNLIKTLTTPRRACVVVYAFKETIHYCKEVMISLKSPSFKVYILLNPQEHASNSTPSTLICIKNTKLSSLSTSNI